MLVRGAPLALRMPGRAGLVLCGIVHGGLRILERIEQARATTYFATVRRSMASTGVSSRRVRSPCGCPGASACALLRLEGNA